MKFSLFPAESEAGLQDCLGKAVAAWQAPARLKVAANTSAAPEAGKTQRAIATNTGQEDLFYIENVLVTAGYAIDAGRGMPVGWNNNDHIFDTLEVWAARHTPEDKPFNYRHECADIIGHTTECFAEALDGTPVPPDSMSVPDSFNIVTRDVLYRVWQDAALQERMDGIVAALQADGEPSWFVSMECLYANFDYCLLDPQKKIQIVARNAETAFLSKHLRQARGTGYYEGKRIGMVLRDLIFSGKGLVENPANPKSVVRTTSETGQPATKEPAKSHVSASGYIPATQSVEQSMEIEAVKTENARLLAENAKLKASLDEANAAKLTEANQARASAEAELTKATQGAAEMEKSLKAAAEQIKSELEKTLAEKTAALATATAELNELKTALAKAEADKTRAERIGRVVAALGLEQADAEKFVDGLKAFDEAAFASHLEVLSKLKATAVHKDDNKAGNTNFTAPGAKTPPTALNAPTPPTAFSAPKPGSAIAALDGAVIEKEPALGAGAAPAGKKIDELRLAFASQLAKAAGQSLESDETNTDTNSK